MATSCCKVAAGRVIYLPDDRAPVAGQRLRLPALARTLGRIARHGPDAFYQGELAERMVAYLRSEGGLHTTADFAAAAGEFVTPIKTSYRGLEVYECPPNGQGVIALLMLNLLEGFGLGELDPNGAERLHLEAEATRLAFRDRNACLADPAAVDVPVRRLLDKDYAAQLRGLIDPERALTDLPPPLLAEHTDTVYLTVVDRDRNVVSFINSVFDSFGSGLACPETGVLFHNRGKSFSLDPAHPNVIAPGKRPMHTIIPALAFEDGRPTDRIRRHGRPLSAGGPCPRADQSGRFRAGSAGGDRCPARVRAGRGTATGTRHLARGGRSARAARPQGRAARASRSAAAR